VPPDLATGRADLARTRDPSLIHTSLIYACLSSAQDPFASCEDSVDTWHALA